MANGATASRLRVLIIDHRLRRYIESEAISLTKEMEKDLLISLSQVLKEIRRWTSETGSESAMGTGERLDGEESPAVFLISGSEEYKCLERIVADFVGLLGIKSPYIQHLAGTILVEVSELLVEFGRQWDVFVHLVCDVLKRKLESTNWYMASGIFRILRNILKRLNQEENDELLGVYFKSISSTLENIPRCLLDKFYSRQHGDGEISSTVSVWALGTITDHDQGIVFLGAFVQFLCSLVQQSGFLEDSNSSELAHLVLPKISDLVPDLLRWCWPKLVSQIDTCMSRYLMHKLLVLMIRLSYQSDLNCTTLLSWLQCLHLHFQGFLRQPISRPEPAQDNCLDGSPLLASLSDGEVHETYSRHLQRLAVFLFLRCSFTLISSRRHIDYECVRDCRKKGLQEICGWIEEQIPGCTFSNQGTCFEKHMDFSTSFVRLYMHEDDLLFKVLLELLSVPLRGEELYNVGKLSPQDEEQNILFCLSFLFNPVNLFCLFLLELHYDHQVLLDYLISKDTGTSCAEYLLRCLRTVCNSWNVFMEFRLEERAVDISSSKKRKILLESSKVENSSKRHRAFEDAKNCLLSLKSSVENLHQKKLFPYNPEVLLKRLSRFQELCLGHE